MKEFDFSDRDLKHAAGLVRDSMLEYVDALPDVEYEYSDGFLEKMNVLIARARRSEIRKRAFRRVASFFLALLIGAGAYLAINTEARAAVISWIRETYEHSVIYRFYRLSENEDLPLYAPKWIPSGYELVEDYISQNRRTIYYDNNETGDSIAFDYFYMDKGTLIELQNMKGALHSERLSINGMIADFYQADLYSIENNLIWISENQNIAFTMYSGLDKSVILHIAESVELDDSTKYSED